MPPLKVWGGNYDGRHRRIVAAPYKKDASLLIGVSMHHFSGFFSETGNLEEMELAMREPGVVWEKGYKLGSEWKRLVNGAR